MAERARWSIPDSSQPYRAGVCLLALVAAACGSPAPTPDQHQPITAAGVVSVPTGPAAPVANPLVSPPPPPVSTTSPAPAAAGADPALAGSTAADATPAAEQSAADPKTTATLERALRAEVQSWKAVPYRDNGKTRKGIGNVPFVQAVFRGAFGTDIPDRYEELYRTGKLVERTQLVPGDLVFFEWGGFGPFRSRSVGLFLGGRDVALARKDTGVTVVSLAGSTWNERYKTARRVPSGEVAAPVFDLATYGSDRAKLLRDIAQAWTGVLYRTGGTTFEGIGNDEFVREVYGAIYETDLTGEPAQWQKMGQAVARNQLEPGDIVIYDAGGFVSQRHAGIYLGGGEFVSAVRGSAVSINKLGEPRWSRAYKGARRIDPDVLARLEDVEEARVAARRAGAGVSGRAEEPPDVEADDNRPASAAAPRRAAIPTGVEQRLREVTEHWRGTPYKLGGTSRSGIDCSAFSRVLYQNVYEMELPRTAEDQEQLGVKVDRKNLQPGDLVFFRTQGMGPFFRSRHVGVYLGGGQFAQASGRRGVTVSTLDNRYWHRKYHTARRLTRPA